MLHSIGLASSHAATPITYTAPLTKSLFPKFESDRTQRLLLLGTAPGACLRRRKRGFIFTHASFIETPVLWAGKLCVFYALLKSGLAGSQTNPFISDVEGGGEDMGFAEWIQNLQGGNPGTAFTCAKKNNVNLVGLSSYCFIGTADKEASEKRKLVSKWHATTKGTLRRNYRVPSKSEGRRLLKGIASLLSEDDHFLDAASHKGCQIRRESAHGESVCCNNVRALFDELPTPHVIVEITAAPLSENDYIKAQKLERVLRSGPHI